MDRATHEFINVVSVPEFRQRLAALEILSPAARFLHVEMDITSKCNLRCRMCYFSFDRYAKSPAVLLSPAMFQQIATSLLPHAHTLTLSLGSEPLTSPHFIPILEIAGRHGVPAITFYTHGLLIDDRVIDAVLRCGVTEVTVSVDGATKETYEHIRRGGNFDRLIGNLRALVARRDSAGARRPMLRVAVVMMRRNVHELEAIVSLAASLGAEEMTFVHVTPYEGLDMEAESLVHDKELSNYWLGHALDLARAAGITVAAHPQPFAIGDGPAAAPDGSAAVYAPVPYCHFPFDHVSINAGGHVLACPFAHGEPAYGTISEEHSFEAVWFGTRFSELRHRILNNDPPAMCRRCSCLASTHPDVEALFAPRPSN